MECEENLPPWQESWIQDFELGAMLLGSESTEEAYYRISKELAQHYRITLCDEPEAQLIGLHVSLDVRVSRGTEIDDMSVSDHLTFLTNYLSIHGLTSADVANTQVRRNLDYTPPSSSIQSLRDFLSGEFAVSVAEVVGEIRRLAGIHSVPTPQQVEAEQAPEGGLTILGAPFDFPACVPGDASSFRRQATARTNGHWSKAASGTASGGTPGSAAMRYQVNKCGRREYSLRLNATSRSHAPLADGLAPTRPGAAKSGFAFACCILEAKYVANSTYTLYQARRDFIRNARSGTNAVPRRLRGLSRTALSVIWRGVNTTQAGQFGAYLGAIADTDIPYWRVVYICSHDKALKYFQKIISTTKVPRRIAVACLSSARRTSENWIV